MKNGEIHLKILKRAALIFLVGLFLECFLFTTSGRASGSTRDRQDYGRASADRSLLSGRCFDFSAHGLEAAGNNCRRFAAGLLGTNDVGSVPGCEVFGVDDKGCNLAAYIDRSVLGVSHIWNQSKVFDPEGLLSTLPSIGTTLAGVLTGNWLRSDRDSSQKFSGMLRRRICRGRRGLDLELLVSAQQISLDKFVRRSIRPASRCVFLHFAIGSSILKGYRKWSVPFLIFGSNAIALYIGSTIMAKVLDIIRAFGAE